MTTIIADRSSPGPQTTPPIPRLQNGDRLSRAEFERRYAAMPHGIKAELVEGVVYLMASPVSESHSGSHFDLIGILASYRLTTPGVVGGDNGTLRLDLDNEPQPDAFLRILPESGGQTRTDADDFIVGAPELVAEVAVSSASYDLHSKLNAYRRNGVREYLVWRVSDRAIDWFILRDGAFAPLAAGTDGITRSEVFPGLWLDLSALVNGDLARAHAVIGQGIASSDHAEFVRALQKRADQGERTED